MALEMKVPSPGESITEVELVSWMVEDGDWVEKDQPIAEVDSDKATLELPAEESGIITRKALEGDVVAVGQVVALIDTEATRPDGIAASAPVAAASAAETMPAPEPVPAPVAEPDLQPEGHGVVEMKVPSPGESITEVELITYLAQNGDFVTKDQPVAEVDSDKATLELPASNSGILTWKAEEGATVAVGSTVALIDTDAPAPSHISAPAAPAPEKSPPVAAAQLAPAPAPTSPHKEGYAKGHPSASAKKMMDENHITRNKVSGTGKGGRITKSDVIAYMAGGISDESAAGWGGTRDEERKRISMLRRKIAERLVSVKNETAMLTTFNEVDMTNVMALRKKHKDRFKEVKGIGLGFMGFFTKAVCEALHHFPTVNAIIDGSELIYHNFADVGIAVSTPKGLMVPVIRNAEQMNLAEIETEIRRLAIAARDGKLAIDEMTGGTFTITNGGVFGSMLSTPILNPPQSAILGMHNIVDRPMAVDGEVKIRPIMYVALSYDHRVIDGKESVGFLYKIKEMIENPERLIFGGKDPMEVLLGL